MPAPYNLSEVSNSTGLGGFVTGMNSISDGFIGLGAWVSIVLITFLGLMLRGHGIRNSFAASSTFSMIIAILLWAGTWINDIVLMINLVMVFGSYVLLALNRN